MKGTFRFRITDGLGNKSYLVITENKWQLMSSGRTPLALSNISSNAAEFGFALEDAQSYDELVAAIKKYAYKREKIHFLDGQIETNINDGVIR